jgi:hypothetical protein
MARGKMAASTDMALAIANGQMDANATASSPMLPHCTDPVNYDSADEANGV